MWQGSTLNTFQILLHATPKEVSFPLHHLAILDIPVPATPAKTEVAPANIEFPRGKIHTDWLPLTQARVSLRHI